MKNKIFAGVAAAMLFAILFSSCKSAGQKIGSGEPVGISVRQEWFPNANFAGELVAMNETAKKNGINLKVEAGSDNIDPIKLVIGGNNDFGVVGADKVLIANQTGADLVVIGVINYNSPTVFITKGDSGIKTPKDFESKTVGVLTGTATEYVYRTLLKTAQVDESKLKEVEAPFDLATFISGQYDVRPAFAYDEPVSLDMQGIKYNIIKPADYGVEFLGTVYFTTRRMVNERPEVVQAFINSVKEGWEQSIKDPDRAIKYLKAYDNGINENRELASLKKGLPYFQGYNGRVLTANMAHWEKMASALVELKKISSPNLKNSISTIFTDKAYQVTGQ